MAYDSATGNLVLFGGENASGVLSDTWPSPISPHHLRHFLLPCGWGQLRENWAVSGSDPARPVGGRQRVYESAAERSRAWRERQRAQREGRDAAAPSPSMAETTLGVLLDRLVDLSGTHERAVGELAHRIERAVATLADPDVVARDLANVRTELANGLRLTEDRVHEAKRERATAVTSQRAAESERDEAVEQTAQAWERAETAEAEVARVRAEIDEIRERSAKAAQDHELRMEGVRIEYEAALDEARVGRQRAEGAADQLRAELVSQNERHQAQIATLRSDAAEAVAASRAEGEERLRMALEDQAAHLAELHQGELSTALAEARATAAEAEARHRGELAEARAAAVGAKELAEARLEEIGRLVGQISAAGGSSGAD